MIRRVLTAVSDATDDEVSEGLGWYHQAHEHAREIADTYGTTTAQAAGVIAALSPQTGWGLNIRLAHDAADHARHGRTDLIGGHTEDACAKASRILQGHDPDDVLGGRKVRSFYANILRPDRPGHVTIDRHALSLLADDRDANARILDRAGVYQRCAAVFRTSATLLTGGGASLRPHEVQAVAWVHWRNKHDVSRHFNYDPTEEF